MRVVWRAAMRGSSVVVVGKNVDGSGVLLVVVRILGL